MCQLASGPRKTTRSCRALYHHNPGPMLLPIGQAPVTQERTRQHSAFDRHCAAVRDWQHCASVAKDRPEQVDGRAGVARSSLVGSVDLFSEHNLFVFFYSLVALTRMRFKSPYFKKCNLASLVSDQNPLLAIV
jgi:hypothetical protein